MMPRLFPAPGSARQTVVLARGPLWKTERHGKLVVRRAYGLGRLLPSVWLWRRWARTTRLFRHYLAVPRFRLVRGRRGSMYVVQHYVAGAMPLLTVTDTVVCQHAIAIGLHDMLQGIARCAQETGWLPDVAGRLSRPWQLYDVRRTDNLVLDPGGAWWLVDTGVTALFHHGYWPTAVVHRWLMLRAIRRLDVRLLAWLTAEDEGQQTNKRGRDERESGAAI